MNILRILPTANRCAGGPVEGAIQITQALNLLGHKTEVVSFDTPGAFDQNNLPFTVYPIGPSQTGYLYNKRLIPWLKQHASSYDVVIIHGLWLYHSIGTHEGLRGLNVPYVVYTHGMLDPYFKHAFPLKHLKKWCFWPWADYRVLRDATAVCFTCEQEKLLARESFWLYKANEKVVQYGIGDPSGDPGQFKTAFYQAFPQLTNKKFILFLSRIHQKKGIEFLIHAFAKISQKNPDLQLVIAGPDGGDYQRMLEKLADELKISEQITWTGMLTGDIKYGAFHAADIFMLPSHQENFGIAVAEALACSTPVLISDKVNIWREIVADNSGFVASDNNKGADELLNKWLSLSEQQQNIMRENARKTFLNRYEIHATAKNFLSIMKEIGTYKD
jgi:glycosyltransferase involved in cell wall biosynthesis